tara:strand:- start:39 stop:587 length:549 start_codon:yes stop_codon:yes gene_type:complete
MQDKLEDLRIDLIKKGFLRESVQVEKIIKKFAKKRKAIYTAAFLTDAAKIELKNWWKLKTQTDLLDNEFVHHMTIKFKPTPDDVLSLPIGEKVSLKVMGYAGDEKGQAVVVSPVGVISSNDIPHITVSTGNTDDDKRVSPAYSNDLLSGGIEQASDGPLLEAFIGFFNGKEIRYDFEDSIYE